MNPAAKNCTVTRIGRLWDAILVTDDGFGALMCQKCVQSQIRLGEWAGGGGGGRRTENRDHMIPVRPLKVVPILYGPSIYCRSTWTLRVL